MSQRVYLAVAGNEQAYLREYPVFPFERDGLRFSNTDAGISDWLVWPSFVKQTLATSVPRAQRILVVTEPGGYFPPDFVNQFGILVSPFAIASFRGVWHQDHGALPAFLGLAFEGGKMRASLDYQELQRLPVPTKDDRVSVVISSKSILPGHRKRLRFVRHLADGLGSRLAVYGRGFHEILDKAEAILPFKYHLVLENTVMPSYWTEKLADAWLGHAFPIVSGPPDLTRWFPAGSFLQIDIDQPEAVARTIIQAMDDDLYAKRRNEIADARVRMMQEERLCALVARVIARHSGSEPRLSSVATIYPQPRPRLSERVSREIARIYWQAESRFRR